MPATLSLFRSELKRKNKLNLLSSLPASRDMIWRDHIGIKDALPKAIKIGEYGNEEALASLIDRGGNGYQICLITHAVGSQSFTKWTNEDVGSMETISPFKYLSGQSRKSKSSLRYLSWLIKYYFMEEKLIDEDFGVEANDFCKRFCSALQIIHDAETARNTDGQEQTDSDVDQDSLPYEPAHDPTSGFSILQKHLRHHLVFNLLKAIPSPDNMEFENHHLSTTTVLKALCIGKSNKNSTWAYVELAEDNHEVTFYRQSQNNETHLQIISAEAVIQQDNNIDPFNYLNSIDPGVSALRLQVLVKWFFFASGNLRHLAPKELRRYHWNLQDALEHVQAMRARATRNALGS